jgi:hypothetical protein
VDSEGNAYVTGAAASADFPTTRSAYDKTFNGRVGEGDAFVTKLDSDGSDLVYSTFLGGRRWEEGNGIAVDSKGNAYVTGWTKSADFPITRRAYDTTHNGGEYSDAFVTKLDAEGSALRYSTFLGGWSVDVSWGIAVDSEGNAYVTGWTRSDDYPTTRGAFDTTFTTPNGGLDTFVTKIGGRRLQKS